MFETERINEYRDDAHRVLPVKGERKKKKEKIVALKRKRGERMGSPGKFRGGNSISEIVLSAVSAKRQSEL